LSLRPVSSGSQASAVAWFFHLIEQVDGRWACRRGLQEYDTHAELHDAVEHVRALAAAAQPAELFVHRLDGSVERLGAI
jgi:hypothetical protein